MTMVPTTMVDERRTGGGGRAGGAGESGSRTTVAPAAARTPVDTTTVTPMSVDATPVVHAVEVVDGRVRLARRDDAGDHAIELHPLWLRDRTHEPGQIESTNRQRLFTPRDIPADLVVTAAHVEDDLLVTVFSDGHVARLDLLAIERLIGWVDDPEQPPAPVAWTSPVDPFPYVDWTRIGWSVEEEDTQAVVDFLAAFFRHGFVVLRDTPIEEGAVDRVANRIGYVTGNNFGSIFDVRAERRPTDLAYTSIELLAHTDQPYRRPVPGIQMLHCLQNEAPGGDSTLVDGLAAATWLAETDDDAYRSLVETPIDFRYDMGVDTVVSGGYTIEVDRAGGFRRMNFNTKLDVPIPRSGVPLDDYYRGRHLLTEWLNDPAHQVTFRLEPGDVMFMDNHRVLHGRTAFDASRGARHLQGCYIDHDGPDTMHRLAIRRLAARAGTATPPGRSDATSSSTVTSNATSTVPSSSTVPSNATVPSSSTVTSMR